jgi:3-oxoacyl-[acyl-carrier protein] reductase
MGKFSSILKRALRYIIKGVPVVNVKAEISLSSSTEKLAGKKIIVTGGGRGLGAAMAKKFVQEGASVLITGRNEDTLKKTSEEIGCTYLVLDMMSPEKFDKFISEAESKIDGLDILVNNAGVSLHENSFFDVVPEGFDTQIDTNFKGGYFLTQSFIKRMIELGRAGNVLFISSETGETVDFRPYGFTKAAVNSMVQGLAHLYAKNNIRVNAIAPGVTASDMTGFKTDDNLYTDYNRIGRIYLPEEVAEVASFLISDISNCVSGQIIACNNAQSVNARWK